MKVIDIDEILEIVDTKFDEVIYKTLNKNNSGWGDVCMFPNTKELFNLKIALINELNTFKIIEEPKEVKLPEKLLMHYNDNVEEEIMLNRARINMILDYLKANELIDEVNKLKKERIRNDE